MLAPGQLWGQSPFWSRVKLNAQSQERATLGAVERVLSGRGEELDLLLVRAALVELMRAQTKDPRTVVLLFHLRRQLGLPPPRGGIARLRLVISPRLSAFDSALAFYELGRLYLDAYFAGGSRSDIVPDHGHEPEHASNLAGFETPASEVPFITGMRQLDQSLRFAWEAEQRSEILFYRGMSSFYMERYEDAEADLVAVREIAASGRFLMNAHLALSLLAVAKGELSTGFREAVTSLEWQQGLAHASQAPLLAEFPVSEADRTVAQILLLLAREEQRTPSETFFADGEACTQLSALPQERRAAPWSIIAQRLHEFCGPPN